MLAYSVEGSWDISVFKSLSDSTWQGLAFALCDGMRGGRSAEKWGTRAITVRTGRAIGSTRNREL